MQRSRLSLKRFRSGDRHSLFSLCRLRRWGLDDVQSCVWRFEDSFPHSQPDTYSHGVIMSNQITNPTIQRFNEIRWHDSKLVSLCFYRTGGEERVKVSLELLGEGGSLTPAELIFKESTYIEADVYLEGKRVCSDDISSADCYVSSEWTKSLSERNPYDSFEGYLHFQLYLIPPGGTINVLARDFSLELKAPG